MPPRTQFGMLATTPATLAKMPRSSSQHAAAMPACRAAHLHAMGWCNNAFETMYASQ